MADATFDVVLIGGGQKSSITAMYLTKYGGMSVGIFEDRHEMCGGWSTEEGAAPGFLGTEWPNFATALGEQATHVLAAATGSVTITGSATGPPVPGVGTGTGVIA